MTVQSLIFEVEFFDVEEAIEALEIEFVGWKFEYKDDLQCVGGWGPPIELSQRDFMLRVIEVTARFHQIYEPHDGFELPNIRV